MTTEQIVGNLITLSTVLGIVWKFYSKAKKSFETMIQEEVVKFIAGQFTEIKAQQKFLSEAQVDIKKTLGDLKLSENSTRMALINLDAQVSASIVKNGEIIERLANDRSQWISENLIKIMGEIKNKKQGA